MNLSRHSKRIAISLAMVMGFSSIIYAAPVYNDVPASHWAYQAISAIADKGIIVGDTSGNYSPDAYINKFDTSKILAMIVGYKYTNLTSQEQSYYNSVYEKHKTFLSQFRSKFTKWNAIADREIAFLYEEGIFTEDDLNQFIIVSVDGTEQLRALSKEECAVFIVRVLGKETDALTSNFSYDFKDDADIKAAYKPYVYYLKDKGIVTGDTDGNFKPKGAVTKAIFAVMLNNSFNTFDEDSSGNSGLTNNSGTSNNTNQTGNGSGANAGTESVVGTVDKLYISLNAIQVLSSATNKKDIYKLSISVKVYIDGNLKTINDLREGMSLIGTVSNSELIEINAQSNQGSNNTTPEPTPTPTPAPEPTPIPTPTPSPTENKVNLYTLEGIVDYVTGSSKKMGIEIRMLNPKGDIITEVREYTASDDCEINRGDEEVEFSDIIVGDIVTAKVSGNYVYVIDLEQKELNITDGTLIEKKQVDSNNSNPILVVKDSKGKTYQLKVVSTSKLYRKSNGTITWEELRIGDKIDVICEFEKIIELNATGLTSTIEGHVEEIHVSRSQSYMKLKDLDGEIMLYYVIPGSIDMYSIKMGDKIRLRLDSKEISAMAILETSGSTSVTGYIKTIKSGSIVLRDMTASDSTYNLGSEVFLDSSTVIVDSATGSKVNASYLKESQKVYVVYTSNVSNIAKTITILNG